MIRLSEYSLLLEKESARLKKLRAGNTMPRPGMAAPSRGGTRVMRIPHDDRYLITTQTIMRKLRWGFEPMQHALTNHKTAPIHLILFCCFYKYSWTISLKTLLFLFLPFHFKMKCFLLSHKTFLVTQLSSELSWEHWFFIIYINKEPGAD